MNNINILLAAVTRNRPLMLSSLLRSLEKVQVPENVNLNFLIVENNDIKSLANNVSDFQSRMPDSNIYYLLEKKSASLFRVIAPSIMPLKIIMIFLFLSTMTNMRIQVGWWNYLQNSNVIISISWDRP